MHVKPSSTQSDNTVGLSCPECDQKLGAWKTIIVDGSGPDRADPTLDAFMRRGVRIDAPETGSVTFVCTNVACSWQVILERADVESIVARAAWEGVRAVRLTDACIQAGSARRQVRSSSPEDWIESRISDGRPVGNQTNTPHPRLRIAMATPAAEQVTRIHARVTENS
jgi:hypothetical protein